MLGNMDQDGESTSGSEACSKLICELTQMIFCKVLENGVTWTCQGYKANVTH